MVTTTKSHVGLLHTICQICGREDEDQAAILLDLRVQDSLERDNYEFGRCSECTKLVKDKLIALVECDPEKTVIHDDTVMLSDAHRTGRVFWVNKQLLDRLMPGAQFKNSMAFIDPAVGDLLHEMEKNDG